MDLDLWLREQLAHPPDRATDAAMCRIRVLRGDTAKERGSQSWRFDAPGYDAADVLAFAARTAGPGDSVRIDFLDGAGGHLASKRLSLPSPPPDATMADTKTATAPTSTATPMPDAAAPLTSTARDVANAAPSTTDPAAASPAGVLAAGMAHTAAALNHGQRTSDRDGATIALLANALVATSQTQARTIEALGADVRALGQQVVSQNGTVVDMVSTLLARGDLAQEEKTAAEVQAARATTGGTEPVEDGPVAIMKGLSETAKELKGLVGDNAEETVAKMLKKVATGGKVPKAFASIIKGLSEEEKARLGQAISDAMQEGAK